MRGTPVGASDLKCKGTSLIRNRAPLGPYPGRYSVSSTGGGGFVSLMVDAVYYPTTPVAPLLPHSPSVIYIHVRST